MSLIVLEWGWEGVHNLAYGKIGYGGDAGSFVKRGVSCVFGEGVAYVNLWYNCLRW